MWNGSVGGLAYNKNNYSPNRIHSGFSLLEVLVALVIMGFVVGSVLQLVGNSLRSIALSDDYSYAIQIAESKLALVGHIIPVAVGSHSGTEYNRFTWSVNINTSNVSFHEDAPPSPVHLYHIVIDIAWPADEPMHNFRLSSLRFGKTR